MVKPILTFVKIIIRIVNIYVNEILYFIKKCKIKLEKFTN